MSLLRELREAEQLLQEVQSWTDDEVDALPLFYRRKARAYRELLNSGED